MMKKILLFITTLLTAISVSNGYGATDYLKGSINITTFLDWFNIAHKYVHIKGIILLDLIPVLFLISQVIIFYKDKKKYSAFFTIIALLANLTGIFILTKLAYPIASQMASWTSGSLPPNWISLKDEWLNYIGLSSLVSMAGWLCFVITYFIDKRGNKQDIRLPGFLNFSKNVLIFLLIFILGMGAGRLYEFFIFPISFEISGITFIEMHRPVDIAIRKVGPILFTVIAALHVLLITLFFVEKSKDKAWLIIASLIFLLCDTLIALRYNGPINDLFLTWTTTTIPANWSSIRDEWLSYHLYRNIFITLGIISILLSFFVKKNEIKAL
jgi:uncharacterized membrane protein